jgi:DNA-binding CsgD family transcriptional regulator
MSSLPWEVEREAHRHPYADGDRSHAHPEYLPALRHPDARQTLTPLEYRVLKLLYAGMSPRWIAVTLGCRAHDVTRAKHLAARWRTPEEAQ